MRGTIAIVIGLLLIVSGIALIVCSLPIFGYTTQEIQTLPPVQKSDTLMDYSFVLGYPNYVNDVAFQMTPSQTLTITARSNMQTSWPSRTFDFSIVIHQPSGIDAVYFSRKDTRSFTATWSPTFKATYHLLFSSVWAGYIDGMDIYAKVVKTYTAADTKTVTVTGVKALIDPSFEYVGLGLVGLGPSISIVALLINRRKPEPKVA